MQKLFFPLLAGTLLACNLANPTAPPRRHLPTPTAPPEGLETREEAATPDNPPTPPPVAMTDWVPGMTWQWQLSEPLTEVTIDVALYDADLFATEAAMVATLHAQGRLAVCYISVGSWEEWQADAADFPPEVIGNDYEGWPGEKWLDIRQIDALAPVMRAAGFVPSQRLRRRGAR